MSKTQTSRRPILVWFISTFLIVVGVGSLAFCYIASAVTGLPTGYLAIVAAASFLTVPAAIALLLLRRQAFPLFSLALLASLIMYAWPFIEPAAFPRNSQRILSSVAGLSLMVAVLFYSRSLKNRGILK
jgi:hypothetical protein